MTVYITTTFSPMMMAAAVSAQVVETNRENFVAEIDGATSAVGHEVTARLLGVLLGREVAFNRANLTLEDGDTVLCVIPNFRASEAREFSREEIEAAGVRYFRAVVSRRSEE